ncbi:MAG: hypothetical protein RLY64_646, partial [Bacteroidota bacterium]
TINSEKAPINVENNDSNEAANSGKSITYSLPDTSMDMILGNVAPTYNSEKDQNPDSSEKKKKG